MNTMALVLCPEMAASLWEGTYGDVYLYDLLRLFKPLSAEQQQLVEAHPLFREMWPFCHTSFFRDLADKTALEHMATVHPFEANGFMDLNDQLERLRLVDDLFAPLTLELVLAYNRKRTNDHLAYEVKKLQAVQGELEIILGALAEATYLLRTVDIASIDDVEKLTQLRADLNDDLRGIDKDPLEGAMHYIAEHSPKQY